MTFKEIDEHCFRWKMRNTWAVAGEIINVERGPGKHDFLISVTSYPQERQILFFLAKCLIEMEQIFLAE